MNPRFDRIWLAAFSGHGSSYRFEQNDKDEFKAKIEGMESLKIFEEAEAEINRWRGLADTIGGDGIVVNVVEFIKQPGWYEGFPFIHPRFNEFLYKNQGV